MNTYQNAKKGTRIGLMIALILCAIMLINGVISLVSMAIQGDTTSIIFAILSVVMNIAILCYAFSGYKKSHGNSLRVLFFIFAIVLALHASVDLAAMNNYAAGDLTLLAALIIAYVSGRLDKLEKNNMLLVVAGLALFVSAIIVIFGNETRSFEINRILGAIDNLVTVIAIGFAYTARYEEHAAAGREEKK